MRYLITGGAGFIGSHLADQLLEEGHQIVIIDDLSTGCYENVAHLDCSHQLNLIVDTVNNPRLVDDIVQEVDGVFHLASAVGVNLVIEQPVRSLECIINGTQAVMRACKRFRRPMLITSSSEVYGKGNKVPFHEDDDRVMGPTNKLRWGYAGAKAIDEFLALANWHQSRFPVVITRLFNTVGPRQTGRYGMVVPRFIRQGLRGDPITVYGHGDQTRCFGHVKDVVKALTRLLALPEARGQVFNVGSDDEVSVLELAKMVQRQTGNRSEIVFLPYLKAYGENFDDMERRVPDLSKVRKLLGYEATYDLEAILQDVIEHERHSLEQEPV